MLFNTIEKQLATFSRSPDKLGKKCSLSYDCPKLSNLQLQQNKNKKNEDFGDKKNYVFPSEAATRYANLKFKTLRSYSAERSYDKEKEQNRRGQKEQQLLPPNNSTIKFNRLRQRCHPQSFSRSDILNINPKKSRERIRNPKKQQHNNIEPILQFRSRNKSQQRPHKKHSASTKNSKHAKTNKYTINPPLGPNLYNPPLQVYSPQVQQVQQIQYYTPQISPSCIHGIGQNNFFVSEIRKRQYRSVSQTGVTGGRQLYELSPIHFNKYMQYKDKIDKQQHTKHTHPQPVPTATHTIQPTHPSPYLDPNYNYNISQYQFKTINNEKVSVKERVHVRPIAEKQVQTEDNMSRYRGYCAVEGSGGIGRVGDGVKGVSDVGQGIRSEIVKTTDSTVVRSYLTVDQYNKVIGNRHNQVQTQCKYEHHPCILTKHYPPQNPPIPATSNSNLNTNTRINPQLQKSIPIHTATSTNNNITSSNSNSNIVNNSSNFPVKGNSNVYTNANTNTNADANSNVRKLYGFSDIIKDDRPVDHALGGCDCSCNCCSKNVGSQVNTSNYNNIYNQKQVDSRKQANFIVDSAINKHFGNRDSNTSSNAIQNSNSAMADSGKYQQYQFTDNGTHNTAPAPIPPTPSDRPRTHVHIPHPPSAAQLSQSLHHRKQMIKNNALLAQACTYLLISCAVILLVFQILK